MTDSIPPPDPLCKAELEKLSADLVELRDSLMLASLALKDHLAAMHSVQSQEVQHLSQLLIEQARRQTKNASLGHSPKH